MSLLADIRDICHKAGVAILDVYESAEWDLQHKADKSPVTRADRAGHDVIAENLNKLSGLPVLSEEADIPDWSTRKTWTEYWLVDPLDGTREFIKRNGEFTVNIALIQNGESVLGVVYSPVEDLFFFGAKGAGAFRQTGLRGQLDSIYCRPPPRDSRWKIAASRSHATANLAGFLAQLPECELVSMGSSLKLCMVAAGVVDLYPRFGPTSEWDTAAGHAIIEAAGGKLLELPTLQPLRYNQEESLLNPSFVACADISPAWANFISLQDLKQ